MRESEVQISNPETKCHPARNAGPLSQTKPHFAPTAVHRSPRLPPELRRCYTHGHTTNWDV